MRTYGISIVFIGAKLFIQFIVTMYNSAENNMINKYMEYFLDFIVQNDLSLFVIYHQLA